MRKFITIAILALSFNAFAQTFNFANRIGGTGWEQGYGITIDNNNNTIVSGAFSSTVDFDPSSTTQNLTSNGLSDIFIAKYNSFGGLVWAKSFGSTSEDFSYNVAVANNGDIYATGFFRGTVDFDPSANVSNLTSNGLNDIFIVKLDVNGSFLWAIKSGGSGNDGANSIKIDNNGNSYICGSFSGTADFDPSANVQNLVSAGGADAYYAKYDNNGNYIFAKRIGNATSDLIYSIALDPNLNIYIAGHFQGTIDIDPNAGVSNLVSAGAEDFYIAKYTNTGNLIWAKRMGGASPQLAIELITDNNGYCYVTGIFDGTCDFDPSSSVNSLTSNGAHDAYIAKYDTSGNYVWAIGYGSTGDDQGYGVSVDGSGNVYGIGYYHGTVDFDPSINFFNLTSNGLYDICVTKHTSSGQFISAKSIGGTGDDLGWNIAYRNGRINYIGHFQNTADFEPNQPVLNMTSLGDFDAFLLSMSTGECTSTIYDTAYVTISDTNFVTITDTNLVTITDTNLVTIVDTNFVTVTDTNFVTITDTNYISVTDTLIINALLTGLNPPNNTNTLLVYPNPSSDHITIDYGNFNLMSGYTLKIENAIGQIVFTTPITQQQSYIDLSSWSGNGIYFVHVIDGSNNTIDIRKIVLQ